MGDGSANNLRLVLLSKHDTLAPGAPASKLACHLALEICHCLLALVFIQLDTFSHPYLLLMLDLEHSANTFNLLRQVARTSPALCCLGRGVGCSESIEQFLLASLLLDDTSTKTSRALATFYAFIPFTGAGTNTSKIVAVTRPPTPASNIHGVGISQVFAARTA